MLRLSIIGPAGAGKGTQSQLLIQQYNLVHFAPGEFFRAATQEKNSLLGKQVQNHIEQGNLVPDELVNNLLIDKIKQNSQVNGFLFDGYPRTYGQAIALDQHLFNQGERDGRSSY